MTPEEQQKFKEEKKKRSAKGNVDSAFYKRIRKLITKVIPNSTCKEMRYLVSLIVLLIVRTYMSIWLADVNGRVVKAIVNKDLNLFIKRVRNSSE